MGGCILGGALLFIAIPCLSTTPTLQRSRMMSALSNARYFQHMIQILAEDNGTAGNPLQWTCSTTGPVTFSQLTNALVADGIISAQDMRKIISSPPGVDTSKAGGTEGQFNVFAVTSSDPTNTLLIASKNWQGITSSNLSTPFFHENSFIVVNKSGEGRILKAKFINNAAIIGAGGQHDYLPLQ